jgi:hypothetical protein
VSRKRDSSRWHHRWVITVTLSTGAEIKHESEWVTGDARQIASEGRLRVPNLMARQRAEMKRFGVEVTLATLHVQSRLTETYTEVSESTQMVAEFPQQQTTPEREETSE